MTCRLICDGCSLVPFSFLDSHRFVLDDDVIVLRMGFHVGIEVSFFWKRAGATWLKALERLLTSMFAFMNFQAPSSGISLVAVRKIALPRLRTSVGIMMSL